MAEHLATVAVDRERFGRAVDLTALRTPDGGAFWEDLLIRIDDDEIDTPVGSIAKAPAGYTTIEASYVDRLAVHVDGPVRVVVSMTLLSRVAACLPDDASVRLEFYGDADEGFARELTAEAGDGTVEFDRLPGPDAVAGAPERMPGRFRGGRFRLEDGLPAPVHAETTAAALQRIVDVVESFDGSDYPLVIDDDGPVLDIARSGITARAPLEGRLLEGQPVHNVYGEGFARAVRSFDDELRLETAPNGPLAIVHEEPGLTSRVVVTPS